MFLYSDIAIMTKEISVFVDESIDADLHSPYYLLCMVFHDQSDDIAPEVRELESTFAQMGFQPDHTVHAGPFIRREDEYANM